jgi:hypothetical protein
MNIQNVTSSLYEASIRPGISFDVEITHTKYQEAIVDISGWLETDDGKIIAELKEDVSESSSSYEIGAKGSIFDKQFKDEIYKTKLVALLDKRALSYIEEERMENKKHDVILVLNLNIKSIDSRAVISYVHELKSNAVITHTNTIPTLGTDSGKSTRDWYFLVYAYDSDYTSTNSSRWILSGNGGAPFLAVSMQQLKKEITIPSSDWIYDYAPKLGLGEYFIVEIPKEDKVIEEAWNLIERAEEAFRRWDTKGVYANCREVGHLLDGIVKEKFGKDGFNYKERWGRAYGKFEHLASLDLHLEELRQKGRYIPEEVKINKDDAEHVLIATKLLIKYAEELIS